MAFINLRDFYPWYAHDEFAEIPDEIAAELHADKRYHKAHDRRMRRNKSYSFDIEADTETSAIACASDNPEAIFEIMERHCRLCRALNSLSEIQGRRVEAFFLLGMSIQEIAESECVSESSVKESVDRGLKAMKKYFSKSFENCPAKCPESDLYI